jgi:hypothetical protein
MEDVRCDHGCESSAVRRDTKIALAEIEVKETALLFRKVSCHACGFLSDDVIVAAAEGGARRRRGPGRNSTPAELVTNPVKPGLRYESSARCSPGEPKNDSESTVIVSSTWAWLHSKLRHSPKMPDYSFFQIRKKIVLLR